MSIGSTVALRQPAATPGGSGVADARTPLIRECWYVAAWAAEIGRSLTGTRILGRQILLYRTEDGRPVALSDRCAHRSLPLSKGWLEGDEVRCAYHGLKFDCAGTCVEAPPIGHAPRAIRVRAYPLAERGPLLWIWMGDGPADEQAIPATDWLESDGWAYASGRMDVQSNYVALHENLLDLTHFTYLHPGNIGTPEYASSPYSVEVDGAQVRVERKVPESGMPAIYRASGLAAETRIWRSTVSEFITPALHTAVGQFGALDGDAAGRMPFEIRVTHFVTPIDQGMLRYHFAFARNFAIDDPAVTERMGAGATQAFLEDADALEAIARIDAAEPDFVEMSMKSDQAGIAMRRIVHRLAALQAGAGTHP